MIVTIINQFYDEKNAPVKRMCVKTGLDFLLNHYISFKMSRSPDHNLNIQSYSFNEILGLFDIKSYDLTPEDMKRAKKKVLMLHPDKSRLTPEYFLFYKKAFDIIAQFYENQNRQNQEFTEKATTYKSTDMSTHNKGTREIIAKNLEKMPEGAFQDKFNQLFESNQMAERPDPRRNEWFTQESASFQVPTSVSAKNMGQAFETIKQNAAGLVKYQGVQNMVSSGGSGMSQLYGDDGAEDGNYVTSDPFSKLKFDDLRKVHKDHTVFAVGEADFAKVKTYGSVDEFNRARNQHSYNPMEKEHAENMLRAQEKAMKENIMRKEYEAKKQTNNYADKNKSILASFLQLGYGQP